MKIAHGKAKGHSLRKPLIPDFSTTLSCNRQQIFELVEKNTHFDFKDKIGLDLFAGTGALGIEALSLGAKHVDFVDKHPYSIEAITHNLNHSYFLGKGSLKKEDVLSYITENYQKYDFVFIDPDSTYTQTPSVIRALINKMNIHGIIVLRLIRPFTNSFYPFRTLSQTKLSFGFITILQN
ncbi:hypothetical protein A2X44_02040 [candidate division CPR3 bacterium GWF2_35_18]|uniref:Methyltransferase n=1 Tax=candidate division CPR3 bacterium GW2011_GWF2_35_18 TaxID=1618350 RepID=A0A0G0ERI4_UNCC3|nr:MAG: Methyltransferase [candidate division CPR3 bacterium GW2011_GWF2_35_18]KKP86379.1 MAG: Methyltransferase [candidate division CPR3 bacterium GW2011_GWE2_35_7]OGB62780.1 MAG: hypothetical protein A2X44_02040 [candidate division CPR3 bacterium GWF2_35_18]OGB65361.1 MAG: hypothetical protein A2250_00255 [candidate division CPR3 bacterium RIFOXYA2_FULL_35_13]OGB77025.1 MAG: hypothetical protein A2476_01070 [candidate division CPR3 bacterium RIFOXYC2_FULL_35_7]OGB79134.1 MAG: hypothetical pr